MNNDVQLLDYLQKFTENFEGFFILDKDGYYVYVSQSWSRQFGFTLQDLQEHHLRVDDINPMSRALIALETGETIIGHPVEWNVKGVDNKKVGFTNYYPILDSDREVQGCFGFVMISGVNDAIVVQNQISELYDRMHYYEEKLIEQNQTRYRLDDIIGSSEAIQDLKKQIRKVAKSNSTVIIEGETGTGKELIAHAIHQLSGRNKENFVRVNCAAIPHELLESELFGYVKGAFTGASPTGKTGKFQFADKGTIFLDEVDSLPLVIQPKFLRVLQEHEIEPIGSNKNTPVDIRVITATNHSLEKEVANGNFRLDLFYRLNVVRIVAPPLRERMEDLPELVENLIGRLNEQLGTSTQGVSKCAMKLLKKYTWPGNVRELVNAIEAAMNIAETQILDVDDFYHISRNLQAREYMSMVKQRQYNLQESKAAFEKQLIVQAIEEYERNYTKVAKMLGISRTTLYKKMLQYNIQEK